MGKVKCFEILLNENKTVYHPGEHVDGRCTIDLKSDLKLRALRVFIRGLAKVHWTESRSTGTRLGTYTEHYTEEIEYFHKKILLFGSDSQLERNTLTAGLHEFDFGFELPSRGITTSFEGKHGSVRYWLRAEMDIPWSLNHRSKKAFTVISPIDINLSEYQCPVEHSIEKSLCCWICLSGPISIIARTDRKGYCPGESIAISADFENHCSRTLIPYATLHQTQTFWASGKSRSRSTKFTSLTGLPISPGKRATWDAQLLKIPAISPSIMDCCLIKVEYYIKVALHIPAAYNLSVHLPVVIGTVPHRRISPYFIATTPRITQDQTGSFFESQMSPSPPPYFRDNSMSQLPVEDPPTYAEIYTGPVDIRDEDDRDTMGDLSYTPMYTYVYSYQYRPPPAYSEMDPHPFADTESGRETSNQPLELNSITPGSSIAEAVVFTIVASTGTPENNESNNAELDPSTSIAPETISTRL